MGYPPAGQRARAAARVGYLAILGLATLTPWTPDFDLAALPARIGNAFMPGATPRDAVDFVRNVALFAGWGAVWVVTSVSRHAPVMLRGAGVTSVAISALIEAVQLVLPDRTTSVLDVASNTVGGLLGAGVVLGLVGLLQQRRTAKSFVGLPLVVFSAAYGTACWLEALIPTTRMPETSQASGGPLERFEAVWGRFGWDSVLDLPLTDFLLFLPLGFLIVAMLAEFGTPYGRAWRTTIVAGVVLAATAEFFHGFLGIPISLGAVLVHGGAIACGAWLAARALPPFTRRFRGRSRPGVLLVAYAAVLCTWWWRPFLLDLSAESLRAQLALTRWIPLHAQSWRVELFSVTDIAAAFCLAFPLGALLSVWPLRSRGVLRGFGAGVLLVVLLELGQMVVAGRYVDGTDVLVSTSAVVLGWCAVRLSGWRPYGVVQPERR